MSNEMKPAMLRYVADIPVTIRDERPAAVVCITVCAHKCVQYESSRVACKEQKRLKQGTVAVITVLVPVRPMTPTV